MATSYPEHDAARRNLERVRLRRPCLAPLAAWSLRAAEAIERREVKYGKQDRAALRLRCLLPALGVLMLAAPVEIEETSYRR